MIPQLTVKIYGKVIIAGEHAVIRGKPAIVVPVKEKFLEVKYFSSDDEFSIQFDGLMKDDLSLVSYGVLEKALSIVKKRNSDLRGKLYLSNSVPVGTGLGASATLCVAIGRFFEYLGWVKSDYLYEFCRQLENLFHGESSGVDIASALMGTPVEFQRPSQIQPVEFNWTPKLYISYCGQRGMTSECVQRVKEFWKTNPDEAQRIDHDMEDSVRLAKKSLMSGESDGLVGFIESINKARSCFERWSLISTDLESHMKKLSEEGALAIKPTGSGRGGYVISLWRSEPQSQFDLIPLKF